MNLSQLLSDETKSIVQQLRDANELVRVLQNSRNEAEMLINSSTSINDLRNQFLACQDEAEKQAIKTKIHQQKEAPEKSILYGVELSAILAEAENLISCIKGESPSNSDGNILIPKYALDHSDTSSGYVRNSRARTLLKSHIEEEKLEDQYPTVRWVFGPEGGTIILFGHEVTALYDSLVYVPETVACNIGPLKTALKQMVPEKRKEIVRCVTEHLGVHLKLILPRKGDDLLKEPSDYVPPPLTTLQRDRVLDRFLQHVMKDKLYQHQQDPLHELSGKFIRILMNVYKGAGYMLGEINKWLFLCGYNVILRLYPKGKIRTMDLALMRPLRDEDKSLFCNFVKEISKHIDTEEINHFKDACKDASGWTPNQEKLEKLLCRYIGGKRARELFSISDILKCPLCLPDILISQICSNPHLNILQYSPSSMGFIMEDDDEYNMDE